MFRYRAAIGLEISDDAARIALLHRTLSGFRIVRVLAVPLSQNPDDAAEVLRGVFQKQGWFHLPCVLALSGESLMLRVLKCGPSERGRDFVDQQIEHFQALANSPTIADYTVSRSPGSEAVMIIGMARLDTVLQQIEYARRIGLKAADIVPGPLAVYNCVARLAGGRATPTVCVDISARSTQVVIGAGRAVGFTRRYLIGSEFLAGHAVRSEDQPDLFSRGEDDPAAARNLSGEAYFKEWLAELKGCLEFYSTRFGGQLRRNSARIVVSGVDRLPQDWVDLLSRATGLKTLHVSELPHVGSLEKKPELLAAAGCALAGIGRERVSLSLIPSEMREERSLVWQLKYWLAAALAIVLGLSAIVLRTWSDVERESALLEARRGELDRLRSVQSRLEALLAENGEIKWQVDTLRAGYWNGKIFEAVLDAVARAKHEDDWITLVADAASYFQRDLGQSSFEPVTTVPRERPQPVLQHFDRIVVEGYTPLSDLRTVLAMIEKLRENEFILAADLLADDKLRDDPEARARWSGYSRTDFAIEIRVARP